MRFTHLEPSRFPALKGAAIVRLLQSAKGDLYIDTFGDVLRFDGEDVRRVTVRGRPEKGIASITRDGKGRIWGTFDGGFGPVDGNEVVPDEGGIENRPGGALQQLGVTHDGGTLLTSGNRLFRIEGGRSSEVRWADGNSIADGIYFFAPGGGTWIGSEFGAIGRLDGTVVHPIPELARMLVGRKIAHAYTEPAAGALWLAVSPSSVLRVRLRTGGAVVVDDFTKVIDIAGAEVDAITQDPTGAIWIATDGRGLIRLSDAPVAMVDRRSGLPEAYYTGLFFDARGAPVADEQHRDLRRVDAAGPLPRSGIAVRTAGRRRRRCRGTDLRRHCRQGAVPFRGRVVDTGSRRMVVVQPGRPLPARRARTGRC